MRCRLGAGEDHHVHRTGDALEGDARLAADTVDAREHPQLLGAHDLTHRGRSAVAAGHVDRVAGEDLLLERTEVNRCRVHRADVQAEAQREGGKSTAGERGVQPIAGRSHGARGRDGTFGVDLRQVEDGKDLVARELGDPPAVRVDDGRHRRVVRAQQLVHECRGEAGRQRRESAQVAEEQRGVQLGTGGRRQWWCRRHGHRHRHPLFHARGTVGAGMPKGLQMAV